MCGRLAGWLRLLGYDAEFAGKNSKVPDIIYRSLREERAILTRNSKISSGKGFLVYQVKSENFFGQIEEVVSEFKLPVSERMIFTRCIACNGEIKITDKENVRNVVPAFVFQTHNKFYSCAKCGKIYWKGSHMELAKKLLNNL